MNTTDRRTFFRKLAAGAALTVLGALTAALASRRAPNASGETCTNRGICRGCPSFAGCGLPQALSARRAIGRREPAAEAAGRLSTRRL